MTSSLDNDFLSVPIGPQDVKIVLVRPQYLGNIGACARICKNFGLRLLTLVSPPNNYKDAEARKMAVGAFDVLKQARVFSTLHEAIADTQLIFGTSSCFQRQVEPVPLTTACEELRASGRSAAFVFGDERNGLTLEELSLCHRIVRIPSNPAFPSLNLSHAVTVVAYELTREHQFNLTPSTSTRKYKRAEFPTLREEDEFFQLAERFLRRVDFLRSYNQHVLMEDLRSLYKRVMPRKREIDLLRGILFKSLQEMKDSALAEEDDCLR